jgi:hypothetical protein
MNITLESGSQLPVDPKFNPICGFNQAGQPISLSFTSDSLKVSVASAVLPTGAATEATLADHRAKSFGLNGSKYITGTAANTDGPWCAIQALEDTVIASMTATNVTGTLSAIPLPAGVAIYGNITAVTLTSGKIIAYKA